MLVPCTFFLIFFVYLINLLIFAKFFHSPSLPLILFLFPFNCIEGFFFFFPSLLFHRFESWVCVGFGGTAVDPLTYVHTTYT